MSADDRRDPTDRPPAVARGPEPLRRRTPTIPYGADTGGTGEAVLPRIKPALRGIRAKTMPPPTLEAPPASSPSPLPPKSSAAINSERYENLRASVEFTAVRDDIDEAYDLEEALAPHLAWLTDDEAKGELFKQLSKGDHGRVLSTMTEARRRYPRNLSIGRCIQIVERAAIARLLERIGPLVLVPEPVGKPVLGRDPATLFAQIDGKATFEDVLRASPFTRLRSLEILAELVRRSAVRVRDDQLPAAVAHLRGASGRTPPHRRASSMRPALSAPVPFADDDVTGRATMPDPLEVATRAALLKEPYESERTPKAPGVGQRTSTPRVSAPPIFDRRTSAGGFRAAPRPPGKESFDAPTPAARRALDERAEYDFPEVRAKTPLAGRVDSPFPGKAQRKGTVRAAAVGVVLDASATVRTPGRIADERRDDDEPDDQDDEQDDIAAKALREVQLERARQAQLARDREAEQKSSEPPESVPARKTLESIAPDSPVERASPVAAATSSSSEPGAIASLDESRTSPPPSVVPSVSLLTPTPAVVAPRLEISAGEGPVTALHHDREPRKLSTGVLGLAALAIVLCFVAVVIAITRTTPAPAPVAQQSQPTAPLPPTATPQPTAPQLAPKGALSDTIRLVIDASPRDARVYVDDVLLTGHPIDQKLPRDGKTHQLRIEAIGYRTNKTTFDANADTKLIIGLELIPQKATPAPVPAKSSDVYP